MIQCNPKGSFDCVTVAKSFITEVRHSSTAHSLVSAIEQLLSEKIFIPADLLPVMISTGPLNLSEICKNNKCRVVMSPSTSSPCSSLDTVESKDVRPAYAIVSGSREGIDALKRSLDVLFDMRFASEPLCFSSIESNEKPSDDSELDPAVQLKHSSSDSSEIVSLNLRIASDEVGRLMGPKGGRIRSLQNTSLCKAFVYKPLDAEKHQDCCLLIKGSSTKILAAVQMASSILSRPLLCFPSDFNIEDYEGYTRFGHSHDEDGTAAAERATVLPSEVLSEVPIFTFRDKREVRLEVGFHEVGKLMGPKGDRIMALEKSCGCRIQLLKPNESEQRKSHAFAISGFAEGLHKALCQIQTVLRRSLSLSSEDFVPAPVKSNISPDFDQTFYYP